MNRGFSFSTPDRGVIQRSYTLRNELAEIIVEKTDRSPSIILEQKKHKYKVKRDSVVWSLVPNTDQLIFQPLAARALFNLGG
jgi:hypothetical protein